MHRREFVAASSAATLSLPGRPTAAPAQKVYKVGLIGSGWYGKCDLFRLIQVSPVEVTALCDVDSRMLREAADLTAERQASHRRPKTYSDYRRMLSDEKFDIVLVATPDHWHALNMIAAVEAGAHVYCQKPISVDVREGQAMLAAARKHNRVVQIGTQRRSTPHIVEAKRYVDEGKLGRIALAETYCYYHMRTRDTAADEPPPAELDWEMWTGPAPMRGYNRIAHPRGWRAFMEYGNGIVGDMCVHMLDMVRFLMGLGHPRSISSEGGILVDKASRANITDTQTAQFDFGETKVVWQHRTWGHPNDPQYPWGATLYGDRGTLKVSVNGFDFIPMNGQPVHKDVTMELEQYPVDKTEKDLERHVAPAIRYHMKNLLRCIEEGGRPVADIEQGYISSTACILANIALKTGRTLHWDAEKGQISGDAEANRLLARPYRRPWKHPAA
jgi:predicted dehydrogenase